MSHLGYFRCLERPRKKNANASSIWFGDYRLRETALCLYDEDDNHGDGGALQCCFNSGHHQQILCPGKMAPSNAVCSGRPARSKFVCDLIEIALEGTSDVVLRLDGYVSFWPMYESFKNSIGGASDAVLRLDGCVSFWPMYESFRPAL